MTSGRGGVYPRGVPVGRVGEPANVEEGWHRSYWVYPTVHPASITHALVGVSGGAGPEAAADLTDLFPGGGLPSREATGGEGAGRASNTEGSG